MLTTFKKICTFFILLLLTFPAYATEISTKATIKYITLEGGFYGLQTQSGQRYIPSNLAAQFKQHGLEVQLTAKKQVGRLGIHMWGEYIDVISMRADPCQPTSVAAIEPAKRRNHVITPVFSDAIAYPATQNSVSPVIDKTKP